MNAALDAAADASRRGDLKTAEEGAAACVEKAPYDTVAQNLLAQVRQKMGRHTEAVALIRQAIALSPGDAVLRLNLGHFLAEAGDWKQAVENIYDAVAMLPKLAATNGRAHLPVVHKGQPLNLAMPLDSGTLMESAKILAGKIYPICLAPQNVRMIVDVGANVGTASAFFASRYPDARILAFEPAAAPFKHLCKNAKMLPNVEAFNVALHARDETAMLYSGENPMLGSLLRTNIAPNEGETVTLVKASSYLAAHGVSSIDILKVDTEGAELVVLDELAGFLPALKVLYVEYHSDSDRNAIDRMMAGSHVLHHCAVKQIDIGEMCYVNRTLVPEARFVRPQD